MSRPTEKGFGTGLRAQLERKQGGSEPASEPAIDDNGAAARSVSEAIAVATLQADGVNELRAELQAARERESALRASLAAQVDARELEQQAAHRVEALDERGAQLAASEAAVAARERSAAEQLAEAEDLRARVAEQHAGLSDAEARIAEREGHIDLKVKELKEAEGAFAEARTELGAKTSALAKQERATSQAQAELTRKQAELEAGFAKLAELDTREGRIGQTQIELEHREADLRVRLERLAGLEERESGLVQREAEHDESVAALAGREADLAAAMRRLPEIEEREVALVTREHELRAQEERVKRSLSVQNDGLGRLADLQAREVMVAAREHGFTKVKREFTVFPGSGGVGIEIEAPDPRLKGESIAEVFRSVGGQIRRSWCGPCFGQGPDALTRGQRAITSFNRNWQNRMGLGGEGYLASPAVVASSALIGYMAPPDELGLAWEAERFGV